MLRADRGRSVVELPAAAQEQGHELLWNVEAVFGIGDLEVPLWRVQCDVVAAQVDHRAVRWLAPGQVSDLECFEPQPILRIEHAFLVGPGLFDEVA